MSNKDFKKDLLEREVEGKFKTPSFKPKSIEDQIDQKNENKIELMSDKDIMDEKSITDFDAFKLPEALINLDKDDDQDANNSEFENDGSDDSDNSDDDDEETAELLAELQRIKKERAEELLKKVFIYNKDILNRKKKNMKKKNKSGWKIQKLGIH